MSVSDPIADFLTRIRNALHAKHPRVDVPASGLKEEVTKVMVREGFIANYKRVEDGRQGLLRIYLKYDRDDGTPVIEGIQRVSTPGRRVYCGAKELPRVLNGLGIAVVSTPRGVLSDREARKEHVGGEVLCTVW